MKAILIILLAFNSAFALDCQKNADIQDLTTVDHLVSSMKFEGHGRTDQEAIQSVLKLIFERNHWSDLAASDIHIGRKWITFSASMPYSQSKWSGKIPVEHFQLKRAPHYPDPAYANIDGQESIASLWVFDQNVINLKSKSANGIELFY